MVNRVIELAVPDEVGVIVMSIGGLMSFSSSAGSIMFMLHIMVYLGRIIFIHHLRGLDRTHLRPVDPQDLRAQLSRDQQTAVELHWRRADRRQHVGR